VTESMADRLTGIFLIGMDWRIAFASFPETRNTAAINGLGQAWTLGAELTFYLIAPLLMRSWKIGAALLVASLGVRAAVVITLGPELHHVWAYMFFPSTVCFFMLGHLICLAGRRWSALARPSLGVACLAASFAFMALGYYGAFDGSRFWSATLCFVLALPGLFNATKSSRWMNALGDLSYPVYLVHLIVLTVGGAALADIVLPLGSPYFSILAWLAVVIAVAAVVHRAIEIPVAHAMRRLMAFSRVQTPAE
jgi:peptidoglycan/LPS O-acetylase OafA/YrhL